MHQIMLINLKPKDGLTKIEKKNILNTYLYCPDSMKKQLRSYENNWTLFVNRTFNNILIFIHNY